MSYGPNDGVGLPKRGIYRKPIRMYMATSTADAASVNARMVSFLRTVPSTASVFVENTAQGYIQYVPNSAIGDKWEVKKPGIYSLVFRFGNSGAARSFGIIRNPSLQSAGGWDWNTYVDTFVESNYQYRKQVLCGTYAVAGGFSTCSTTVYLNQGDFIMLATSAGPTSSFAEFIMEYVGQG